MNRRTFLGGVLGTLVASQVPFHAVEAPGGKPPTGAERHRRLLELFASPERARISFVYRENDKLREVWAPRIERFTFRNNGLQLQAREIRWEQQLEITQMRLYQGRTLVSEKDADWGLAQPGHRWTAYWEITFE